MGEAEAPPPPKRSINNICCSKSQPDTFYSSMRCLGILSKVFGSFPLANVTKRDGRKLTHSWFSLIYLFDLISGCVFLWWYVESCNALLSPLEDDHIIDEDQTNLAIWLTLTCYIVVFRGIIQFLLVHAFASRLPALFTALDEYYHGIGLTIIKPKTDAWYNAILSIIWTILILLFIQTSSYYFFKQLNADITFISAWPMALSYMFANIWKELPMNMFTKICVVMTSRFSEIKEGMKSIREKGGKDGAKDLEVLRLQHAALTRILTQLQRCYGMQLAVNIFFMLMDTVLQLFVFFIITCSENVLLLALAFYYVLMSFILLAIVDQMERTDESLLEEIAAFELYSAPRDQQLQIQLFTAQLTARPVRLSASGFFFVNNAMLCTILGAIATYLIMLIQFTPYLNMQTPKNITIFSLTQYVG